MIQIADYPTDEFDAYFKAKMAERGANFELFEKMILSLLKCEQINDQYIHFFTTASNVDPEGTLELETDLCDVDKNMYNFSMNSYMHLGDEFLKTGGFTSITSEPKTMPKILNDLSLDEWFGIIVNNLLGDYDRMYHHKVYENIYLGLYYRFPELAHYNTMVDSVPMDEIDVEIHRAIITGDEPGTRKALERFFVDFRGVCLPQMETLRMNHYFDFLWMRNKFLPNTPWQPTEFHPMCPAKLLRKLGFLGGMVGAGEAYV